MRILVTGATGYLGLHICEYLKSKNYSVTGFIRNPKKADPLNKLGVPYFVGDILDKDCLKEAMKDGYDLIINNAGYISDRGPWKKYREINVQGVENVAEAMKSNNIRRIIQISSIAAYGVMGLDGTEELEKSKPRWFKYGVTKQEGEEVLRGYREFETTILRPGHIVGRRDKSGYVPILYYSMRKKRRWINKGQAILPLVYLGDVLQAIEICIENPDKTINNDFTLVSPERKTVRDVMEQIHEELNVPMPTKNFSYRFAFILGMIFESLMVFGFNPPMTRMGASLAGLDTHFSSQKIMNIGWQSTKSVSEMIKEWTDWRKEYEKNRK